MRTAADTVPAMTHPRHYAATLAVAAALAGCTNTPQPTAAPTSATPTTTAPSPTPSADERRGCRAFAALDEKSDPTAYRDAGALAAEAPVASIRQAGIDLINAANSAVADPGNASRLELDRASLKLVRACGDEYGEGPW